MEGFLSIKGSFFGLETWTRRWVVMKGGVMYICRDTDRSQVGKLSVPLIDLLPSATNSDQFSFYSGMRLFKVKAESPQEKLRWENAIAAIKESSEPKACAPQIVSTEEIGHSGIDELVQKVALIITHRHAFEINRSLTELSSTKRSMRRTIDDVAKCIPAEKMTKIEANFAQFDKSFEDANKALLSEQTMIKTVHEALSQICRNPKALDISNANNVSVEQATPEALDAEKVNVRKSFIKLPVVSVRDQPINPLDSVYFQSLSLQNFCESLSDKKVCELLTTNLAFKKYPLSMFQPSVRTDLPALRDPNVKLNVVKLIKDNLGKDLSKISMPVYINEPISGLQKTLDFVEYTEILKTAANCPDRFLRLAYVMASYFISFASGVKRVKKPFNPLLGETYEIIGPGYRAVSEQITHHPPITAYHIESPEYVVNGNLLVSVSFGLFNSKILLKGPHEIFLKTTKETFVLTRPSGSLHNVFQGQIYTWFNSDMIITNTSNGDRATVTFLKKTSVEGNDHLVKGTVTDSAGNIQLRLSGSWDKSLIATTNSGQTILLGEASSLPPMADKQYSFTSFVRNMNNLTPKIAASLPRTDSRFRPDLRAYENGDIDLADIEKKRIEENQRARRKANSSQWQPVWFKCEEKGDMICSQFKGEYWKCKESGKWPADLLNLFN